MRRATIVDAAVAAARRAFDAGKWATMAASRRAKVVYKLAQLIAERSGELALLEVRDNGKTIGTAKGELGAIVDAFEFYAGAATKNYGETLPPPLPTYLASDGARAGRRRRRDRSVELSAAARIVEGRAGVGGWMHDRPQALVGDAAHRDRARQDRARGGRTRGRAQRGHRCDARDRRVAGRAPGRRQDRLHWLDRNGRTVAATAARTLKRVTLELGGKSPSVVFDDADVDAAVAGALYGVYYNAGQCCEARTRILVQSRNLRSLRERFRRKSAALAARAIQRTRRRRSVRSRLRDQYDKIKAYCEIGAAEGAKALFGGGAGGGGRRVCRGKFLESDGIRGAERAPHRARRDLRPGRDVRSIRRRSGGDRTGQRERVRPRRQRLVE